MKKPIHEICCVHCDAQLVIEDQNGTLEWGTHENWCPARKPEASSPGRKSAMAKLICADDCNHSNLAIHDLGEMAFCEKCPRKGLAVEAVDAYVKNNGGQKPVEVIYPALRRRPAVVPLSLYTDLLERYVAREEKRKRRK